ncbi:MAG TPA: helix-turn-helix domain-containing protein [Candidatus Deferrimicrobiaceae bacterium]|nr:helix-turn-helix domain-containing protein [Candidatus Deferrimicrobiaceae bacterium]
MSPQAIGEQRAAEAWLSLGPASELVGVDPDTLRRWADDGRVRAFSTPGGHRRFDRRDLERLLERRQPRRRSLADLGATPERVVRAYTKAYRMPDEPRARLGAAFAAEDRAAFRDDGRQLVTALLRYLDARTPATRRRWEAHASDVVAATGTRLAAAGGSVDEAIATFITARRPFLASLGALGRRGVLDGPAVTALYDDAVALLDRLLLILVSSFNARR